MATSICSSKGGGREILHRMTTTVIRPQSLHIPLITSFSSCTFVSRHSYHYHSQHISSTDFAPASPSSRNRSSTVSQISTSTVTIPSSTTMTTVNGKNNISCNCTCSSSTNPFSFLTPASSFSSYYYYYYPFYSILSYFFRAPSVCHRLASLSSSSCSCSSFSSWLHYRLPISLYSSSCTSTAGCTRSHRIMDTTSNNSRSRMRNITSRKSHMKTSCTWGRRWYSMNDPSPAEGNEDKALLLLLLGPPPTKSLLSLANGIAPGVGMEQQQQGLTPSARVGGDDSCVRFMGSARGCSRNNNPLLHACRYFHDNAAAVGGGGGCCTLEKEEQGKGKNAGEEEKRGAPVVDAEEGRNKETEGGNGKLGCSDTPLRPGTCSSSFSPPPPPPSSCSPPSWHSSPQYRIVTITEKKRISGERVSFFIHCDPYFSNGTSSESSSISSAEDLRGPPTSPASPSFEKEKPLPNEEGSSTSPTSVSSTLSPSSSASASSVDMPSTVVGQSGGNTENVKPAGYYPPHHHHHQHHHHHHHPMPSPSPYTPAAVPPPATPPPSSSSSSSSPLPLSRPALTPSPVMMEPVKRVLLLRCGMHAAQEDKKSLIHSQDWRIPLLPEGKESSREMGRNISELVGDDPVYIYHSPYTRAREAVNEVIKGLKDGRKAREEWNREEQEVVVEEEVKKGHQAESDGDGQHTATIHTQSSPSSSSSSLLSSSSLSSSPIIGVREDARLRGGDMGRYDHVEEMMFHLAQCEKYGSFFYRFPHGESGADVCDRITSFIGSFQRERLDLAPNTNVLLVTHDIVIRMFLKRWFHLNVETFHQMHSIPPSSLITMTRVHHQSSFRLNEECVEILGLPLSLNEHNGYRYRNKNFLGSMSSGAPFM